MKNSHKLDSFQDICKINYMKFFDEHRFGNSLESKINGFRLINKIVEFSMKQCCQRFH